MSTPLQAEHSLNSTLPNPFRQRNFRPTSTPPTFPTKILALPFAKLGSLGALCVQSFSSTQPCRQSRNSLADRSTLNPARNSNLLPIFPSTPAYPPNPANARIFAVSSKLSRDPIPRAIPRTTRRRVAASIAFNRSISTAHADSPTAVLTARPPPRTGFPGNTTCGKILATSTSQCASSSRAITARFAKASSTPGLNPRNTGINSCRTLFRVNPKSRLLESVRQSCPRPLKNASTSTRRTPNNGRTVRVFSEPGAPGSDSRTRASTNP